MTYVTSSERLLLRELTSNDAPNLYLLNADPDVLTYTGDKAFRDIDEATFFLENYRAYTDFGMGRWAIDFKHNGQFIGWCGLNYSIERQEVDLGFRLFRQFWNKGLATEAGLACIQYGFDVLHIDTIVGRADTRNLASIRVLEKLGMQFWKEINFDEHQGVCYKIDQIAQTK